MHEHHKYAGEENEFRQALSVLFYCENRGKKSLMRPLAVQNMNTNPLCEYAHQKISHGKLHSSTHLNMQMFPGTKSLDKLLLHDSCGCRHNSLKIYYRRQSKREESSPRQLPGRCVHVARMHVFVGACVRVCVCSQRNVIMSVVFLYCPPEYEMRWVILVMKGLVTEGIKTFKEINPDRGSAGSQTLCTDHVMLEERI